ncbi:MAG: aminotransferase class I/II-fold pyridoxal phosphate-dependent enzyme, partial [Lacisediminimonas sp.]|nr:aminotransferase class I/II-fold pyridoxal phosphate-dependent enzyme [Lacisediminimonas sp.]
ASAKVHHNPPLLSRVRERLEQQFMPHWKNQWGGKCILHGRSPGPESIRLDGNDYLGISGNPDIVRAQIATLRRDNDSVIQSGAFLLDAHPSRTLEASLASWVGKEDGFVCQSGYAANVGLLQAIADEQTPVYLDTLAHTSLWEGGRAARAPAYPFRHNDPAHLARMIARHGPGIVVVDSVYSTTGALCPLADMVAVVEQHGCTILVDESHSLGSHGPQGAGLCAELGLTDRVHFITASLAKAFAGKALVSGLCHRIDGDGWVTVLQFGLTPQAHRARPDIAAPAAAGLWPAVGGLQLGVVEAMHEDPNGEFRVKVKLPGLGDDAPGYWARMASPDAGNAR